MIVKRLFQTRRIRVSLVVVFGVVVVAAMIFTGVMLLNEPSVRRVHIRGYEDPEEPRTKYLNLLCFDSEVHAEVGDQGGAWMASLARPQPTPGAATARFQFASDHPPPRPQPLGLLVSGAVSVDSLGTSMRIGYKDLHYPPRMPDESMDDLMRRARALSERGEAEVMLAGAVYHDRVYVQVQGDPSVVRFDLRSRRGELQALKAGCEAQRLVPW